MKVLLLVFAAALSAALFLQWKDWRASPTMEPIAPAADLGAPTAPTPTDASDLLLPPPPKEDYASVVERPLFLPDRRPPPEEPEEQEEVVPEEMSDLAGTDLNAVLITPSIVSAWVRTPTSPDLVRLRLGDDLEGWTVSLIEPERLVLERQGETNELVLRDYSTAAPPASASRRRPVPTPASTRQDKRVDGSQAGTDPRAARRLPRPPSTPPVSRRPLRPDQRR